MADHQTKYADHKLEDADHEAGGDCPFIVFHQVSKLPVVSRDAAGTNCRLFEKVLENDVTRSGSLHAGNVKRKAVRRTLQELQCITNQLFAVNKLLVL